MKEKLWQFDDTLIDIKGVKELLSKYSEGLNKQQDTIKASIDVSMNYDSEAEMKLFITDTNLSMRSDIFKVTFKISGKLYLETFFYSESIITPNLSIEELETLLDERVKDERIGNVIGYYISVIKRNRLV